MSAVAAQRSLRHPSDLRCLILNADFSPLSTYPPSLISAQDAITALWRERADVVETWEGAFFRSPSTTIAVPKVMALKNYANVNAAPKFCRRNILLRDRHKCQYCGQQFPVSELTYDHLVPRSKGGVTKWENIVTACIPCNAAKADKHANLSGRKAAGQFRPLKMPRQPTTFELLRAGMEFLPDDVKEDWGSYLYWNTTLEK